LKQLAAFGKQAAAGAARFKELALAGSVVAHSDAGESLVGLREPQMPETGTTFTVNSTADDPLGTPTSKSCKATNSKCTLRAAISAADNLGTAVTIKLSSDTYELSDTTGGTMVINDPGEVSVVGTSPSKTTISVKAGDDIQPFGVGENSKQEGGVLFLSGLAIEGGSAVSGGALIVGDQNASAVLTDVDLQSNLASGAGGGIASEGHLWVTDSTIKNNEGTADGGGIAEEGGSAVVADSTITGNATSGDGGGLIVEEATLAITGGSVSSNAAGTASDAGEGGGIAAGEASVNLSGTTVNSNAVNDQGEGGGLILEGASLVMQDGQLSHNSASDGGAGGGAFIEGAAATLTDVATDSNTGGVGGILALGEEVPTSIEIVGGSVSDNDSQGVVALAESTGGLVSLDVSGAKLDGNRTPSSAELPCASAVCAGGVDGGIAQVTLTNDSIEDDTAAGTQQLGGAVEAVAGDGSCSADLQGDTIDDDTGPGAKLSAGGVLFASDTTSSEFAPMTITVANSTFEHDSVGDGGDGGAIGISTGTVAGDSVTATVSMSGDTFEHDTAGTSSSAVASAGGAVSIAPETSGSITGSTFSDNAVKGGDDSGAGAILDEDESVFSYANDTFTSNSAEEGGALILESASATISRTTFSHNTAEKEAAGLGMVEAAFSVSGSTFSDNSLSGSDGEGAGVVVVEALGTISNSTLTGNSAGKSGEGGGILADEGEVTFDSDTVTANVAGTGSGVYTDADGQALALKNTIISHNTTKAAGGSENDCGLSKASGTVAIAAASEGGNVLGRPSCVVARAPSDKVSTNPKLNALAKNGGPTETMSLGSGSPALKIGVACLPTDQRGTARPATKCDSGAYELTKA
jgi:CSLREA domain-containing protein